MSSNALSIDEDAVHKKNPVENQIHVLALGLPSIITTFHASPEEAAHLQKRIHSEAQRPDLETCLMVN